MDKARETKLAEVATNLWTVESPLSLLGMRIGRRTTVIRLESGGLVLHSSAPFSAEAAGAIRRLGKPLALVEGTLLHDTFALPGRAAFPEATYFAPDDQAEWNRGARPLSELSEFVGGELTVHPIEGIPQAREYVVTHPASATAIVCDLIFNIQPPQSAWTAFGFKYLNGCYARPGMTRLFRTLIRDKAAFRRSVEALLQTCDFDRLIPGHGAVVESGGKTILREELRSLG